MAEYIDREALIKAIDNNFAKLDIDVCNPPYYYGANDEYADIRLIIHKQPAADVQAVRRGKWDFQGYQLFKCTNCKEMFTQDQLEAMQNHKDCEECAFPNFCPNCGADMRTKI